MILKKGDFNIKVHPWFWEALVITQLTLLKCLEIVAIHGVIPRLEECSIHVKPLILYHV